MDNNLKMALDHKDIWQAIDRLAERHGLTPSALARRSGLSPTAFNPSKRMSAKRKRWPSTESISQILGATNTSLDDFVALAMQTIATRTTVPLLPMTHMVQDNCFDEKGHPKGNDWQDMTLPGLSDPNVFAVEVMDQSLEPIYRRGDRLVLSPLRKPCPGDRVIVKTKKQDVLVRELGRVDVRTFELKPLMSPDSPLVMFRRDIDWFYSIAWASQS